MITKKPSILFVHPDLRGGGAEKVLVNLLNTMNTDKYDIHLFTYFHQGVNRKNLKPEIKQRSIFNKVFRGWSVIQKIFTPKQLYKFFIKGQYDVVIAYLEGVPTRMVSGCPHSQTKIISWLHTDLNLAGIEGVYRSDQEMKSCYRQFDNVIAVSKKVLSTNTEYCSLSPDKVNVLHNVINIEEIISNGQIPLDGPSLKENTFNICSVGRLTKVKGYDRLIKVFGKLIQDYPNTHLYLLGTGECKESLMQLVSQNGLENHISFLGFQKNPHQYVAKCDLFVCSSYNEGYSTAVTESVILGTPVLTTNCPGMDEILDNGETGMIVENSSEGLYDGLYNLLSQPALLSNFAEKTKYKASYYRQNNNTTKVEILIDNLLN